ncbi:MAG: lactoylglutathione lyase [Rhodobacteraceae bacterium]|nr:lactoylglutathione lyase [Paracoccaceae bacterium]
MKYLHTMVRVTDIDASMHFYCDLLGLEETWRFDSEAGQFTNIFLAAPKDKDSVAAARAPELELTYNWNSAEKYQTGRSWGHLAYRVSDIYAVCQKLMDGGVTINRPPRDGHMAFIKSPDNVSVELLQDGDALASQEPWASMSNSGAW